MRLLFVYLSYKAFISGINTLSTYEVAECCLFSHNLGGVLAEDITCNWHDGRVPPIVSQI